MKILHICLCGPFYEKYAYQDNLLPKYHRKAGHNVTILAPYNSQINPNNGKTIHDCTKCKYLEDGIKVRRVKSFIPDIINSHIHIYYGVWKIIKEENPDLIFAHGVVCPNYLLLSKYKRMRPKIAIVYDNHADFVNSLHSSFTRWWARHVARDIIVKKILWTSNNFYGTTPARCDFLRDFFRVPSGKISLLPMGADDEQMNFKEKKQVRQKVRNQFNVKDDDFLIVTGGKIDKLKNIHSLVEAVIRIGSPVKILVFGSIAEDMRNIFDSLKATNTIYVGWIPSNEVYSYYYAADLIAFPGLHSVLWEQAVASQVPTAFSKIDGFEHINYNNNSILFEDKTPEYYESVLKRLINDRNWYEVLKHNSESEKSRMFLYSEIAHKVIEDVNN